MTALAHDHSAQDTGDLAPPPAAPAAGADWVSEAAAGPAEFELFLDETTGLYEVRRVAGAAAAFSEQAAPTSVLEPEPEPVRVVESVVANDSEPDQATEGQELIAWASLAGLPGPSAFHTPLFWGVRLSGEADFSPVPALSQSRGGSAWPVEAAA